MSQTEQDLTRELKSLSRKIRVSFALSAILCMIFLADIFGGSKLLERNQSKLENAQMGANREEIRINQDETNDSVIHDETKDSVTYDEAWMNQASPSEPEKDGQSQEVLEQPDTITEVESSVHVSSVSTGNISAIPVVSTGKFKPLPPVSKWNRVTIDKAMEILKNVPFQPPPLSQQPILNPNLFKKAQQCLLNSSYVPRGKVPLLHNSKYTLPKDAEAHYIELLNLTAPLRNVTTTSHVGYNGPWLEDAFISEFCCDRPLSYFGGLVPLFVQWTDLGHLHGEHWHNHTLGRQFFSKLRKDVIYLVISQHADGIFNKFSRLVFPKDYWNLLILSGGGLGHAAVPLFIKEQPYEDFNPKLAQYLFVFAGTLKFRVRTVMADTLDELSLSDPPVRVRFYNGRLWQKIMRTGLLCLAPRGYGRTSFRLAEAIQMGLIPVYLYDDHDWSPYPGSPAHVSNLGYSMPIGKFKAFAEQMAMEESKNPTKFLAMLEEKRAKIRQFRDSHYTLEGLMQQIAYFIQDDPRSSIKCQRNLQRA